MNQFQISPDNFLLLIADDTESNVKLLSHVLREVGYNVIAAFNGNDALELASARKPDLILLDVLMPDLTGFEVSKKLKTDASLKDIPVIFISALTDSDDVIKGFEAGGVDYIIKPFKKNEILARIRTHLILSVLQRERDERIKILKLRENELQELNKQKDELVRMVSHDIQNPLTGIIGLSALLQKELSSSPDDVRNMLSIIEQSGRKLISLVDQVLKADKRSDLHRKLTLSDIYIRDVFQQILDVNAPKALLKGIKISFEDKTRTKSFRLDVVKIEIALNNLVANALKFTQSKGSVTLRAETTDDKICIEVIDTGIGIPENMVNDLFSTPGKERTKIGTEGEIGTGLGLDIVQDYVHLHKGTITVSSIENEGTTFRICIPIIGKE